MATRQLSPKNLTIHERAATLTAKEVRFAARQYIREGRKPPAGLGSSRFHDVWIDLSDGDGPQRFPPKVILCWATGGQLPDKEGYGHGGPWTSQLRKLGFPVLPKGQEPKRGQDCRGVDLAGKHRDKKAASSSAKLPHVVAYRALTAMHLRAATQEILEMENIAAPDPYFVWIDGKAYPFWRLFRAAVKAIGGGARHRRSPPRGYQPEHELVRGLGLDVLPRGIGPVAAASPGHPASALPPLDLVTTSALERAAELIEGAPDFRDRREGAKYEMWVSGRGPYPIKAMCLLAFHILGFGWHEDWTKGGANSPMDRHLRSLPGVQIAPKGSIPDADGGRARALVKDLGDIGRRKLDQTTRERLIDARLGQGGFRRDVDRHWGYACAVTGIKLRQALRASHIIPWQGAGDDDRLDPNNGLLLVATLDALFDKGLISFADDGELLVGKVSDDEKRKLGLHRKLGLRLDAPSSLTSERIEFLRIHRQNNGFADA